MGAEWHIEVAEKLIGRSFEYSDPVQIHVTLYAADIHVRIAEYKERAARRINKGLED